MSAEADFIRDAYSRRGGDRISLTAEEVQSGMDRYREALLENMVLPALLPVDSEVLRGLSSEEIRRRIEIRFSLKQLEIFLLHYGLYASNGRRHSIEEIAGILKINQMAVERYFSNAINKLEMSEDQRNHLKVLYLLRLILGKITKDQVNHLEVLDLLHRLLQELEGGRLTRAQLRAFLEHKNPFETDTLES